MKFLSTSLLILFASGAAHATTVDSYLLNSDGIDKLQAKSYYPAFQDFIKALQEDPLNPQLHMNLGLALEMNEEFEKAEQAYKGALRLIPASDPSPQRGKVPNPASSAPLGSGCPKSHP